MQVKFSEEVDKEFKSIKRKDQQLVKRIKKQLLLFQQNPRYPSLRLHKITGDLNKLIDLRN